MMLFVSTGDLKKLIRRMADAGKRFDEAEIWHYFSQVRYVHAAETMTAAVAVPFTIAAACSSASHLVQYLAQ